MKQFNLKETLNKNDKQGTKNVVLISAVTFKVCVT